MCKEIIFTADMNEIQMSTIHFSDSYINEINPFMSVLPSSIYNTSVVISNLMFGNLYSCHNRRITIESHCILLCNYMNMIKCMRN